MFFLNKITKKNFSIEILKRDINFSKNNIIKELNNFDPYIELQSKYYPKNKRYDFLVINYFHFEMVKIVNNFKDKSIALAKLDFWKDTIEDIYNDKLEIKDPLSIGLCELKQNYNLNKNFFISLINSKKNIIDKDIIYDYVDIIERGKENYRNIIYMYLIILNIEPNKNLFKIIENITTIYETVNLIKAIPYNLNNNNFVFPEKLKEKHGINLSNLWDRLYGKPKEELMDAILELSAFGRNILKDIINNSNDLPPNTFRAFLRLIEFEYFFELLEKHNFNIFINSVVKRSYFTLPLRYYKASKNKKFYLYLK